MSDWIDRTLLRERLKRTGERPRVLAALVVAVAVHVPAFALALRSSPPLAAPERWIDVETLLEQEPQKGDPREAPEPPAALPATTPLPEHDVRRSRVVEPAPLPRTERPPEVVGPTSPLVAPAESPPNTGSGIAAPPVERPEPRPENPGASPAPPHAAHVAAPSPDPTGDPAALQKALHRYRATLVELVDHRKRYPPLSLRRREEGTVVVRVRLASSGAILGEPRAGGPERLVRASLDAVREAGPFPPLPPLLQTPSADFEIPVVYRIRRDVETD